MFEKTVVLSVPVLLCCGWLNLSEKSGNKNISVSDEAVSAAQTVVFAPAYKSSAKDKFHDAAEIYDSSPKASQGVCRYGNLIFVIVCIDTNKEDIEYLEGTAMLRAAALLRRYYPELPRRFRIPGRIVENGKDDNGIYRYAAVCREKDITRFLTVRSGKKQQ